MVSCTGLSIPPLNENKYVSVMQRMQEYFFNFK